MADTPVVTMDTVSTVISSIRCVVSQFFGPQCGQTLLTSSTGKAVITSDGFTILECLQPSHPVAVLVSQAIRRCHGYTMDGTKTFLLYLSFFIEELDKSILAATFSHNGESFKGTRQSLQTQSKSAAQKALESFKFKTLPQIVSKLVNHSELLLESLVGRDIKKRTDLLFSVAVTTLAPHFNPKMALFFARLLRDLVTDGDGRLWPRSRLQVLVDKMGLFIIKVPNRPYFDCTGLDDTILIQRDFSVFNDCLKSNQSINVLLSHAFIECTSDSDSEKKDVYLIKSGSNITDNILQKHSVVNTFVKKCVRENINLFICGENVPSFALEVFKQNRVSVIANIHEDEFELVTLATGKMAVSSVYEDINKLNVIQSFGVEKMVIGGQRYVSLKLGRDSYIRKQLVVCAPSVGLCDQLTQMLQKALNSMLMCIDGKHRNNGSTASDAKSPSIDALLSDTGEEDERGEDIISSKNVTMVDDLEAELANSGYKQQAGRGSGQEIPVELNDEIQLFQDNQVVQDGLYVIEGGGSFEVLFAKILAECQSAADDSNEKAVCKCLEEALMRVMALLYDNVTGDGQSHRHFLAVRTQLLSGISTGPLLGLSRRGAVMKMGQGGVLEPLLSKLHILECVLSLVCQLLRIDMMVSVK